MLQPFVWGQNGQALTPDQAQRYRKLSEAMLARNSRVATNPWEGLSQLAGAFSAAQLNGRASEAEQAGRAKLADALKAGNYSDVVASGWASPQQSALASALMQRGWRQQDLADQRSYDAPLRDMQLQKGRLELDALQNPAPPAPDYGFMTMPDGTIVRTDKTGGGVAEMGQFGAGGFRPLSMDEKAQYGIPADVPAQIGPDGKVSQIGGSQVAVNVNNGEPGDQYLRQSLDKKEGEAWSAFKDAAAQSASNSQDFQVLDQLVTMAPQGPIEGRIAEAFPGFSAAGDAFQSIVKRIAPTLRAPGSGSTSDIEYDGMLRSLPALRNKPEANKIILEIMRAKANLNIQRGDVISSYQTGQISAAEARNKLSELNRVSIISPEMKSALSALGGNSGGTTESGVQWSIEQ